MSNLIDRQKLIDVFTGLVLYADLDGATKSYFDGLKEAYNLICQCPSAHPEPRKGRWIEYIPEHGKCPFCGNQVDLLNGKANSFCGECGADMRG